MLKRRNVGATFLFSLGPDHTGRAVKRVFRRGFVSKVSRTSVLQHYGLLTLLYGTLLPGPDIGRRCADILRAVRAEGFEVGVHCWDHVAWQDGVATAPNAWVERQMGLAVERYTVIFGERPRVHGAAGWQMSPHAFHMTERLNFDYASDTRGHRPFIAHCNGAAIACPQLPTTLPTLDELIGRSGLTAANVHDAVLERTAQRPPAGHVFTAHAELEGQQLLPVLERLIDGWRAQGYEIVPMRALARTLDVDALPHHRIIRAEIEGRAGTVAVQELVPC